MLRKFHCRKTLIIKFQMNLEISKHVTINNLKDQKNRIARKAWVVFPEFRDKVLVNVLVSA